ncbi:hypothetical protein ACSBR1_002507 [Camellia fascicularis]
MEKSKSCTFLHHTQEIDLGFRICHCQPQMRAVEIKFQVFPFSSLELNSNLDELFLGCIE